MPRHYKIDDKLSREHRAELLKIAVEPSATVDQIHRFVRDKGYFIGRTACHSWLTNVRRLGAHPLEQIIRLLRTHSGQFKPESIERIHRAITAELAGTTT